MARLTRVSGQVLEYRESHVLVWGLLAFGSCMLPVIFVDQVGQFISGSLLVRVITLFSTAALIFGLAILLRNLRFSRRISFVRGRGVVVIQDRGVFGVRAWEFPMSDVLVVSWLIRGRHGEHAWGANTVLELRGRKYFRFGILSSEDRRTLAEFLEVDLEESEQGRLVSGD